MSGPVCPLDYRYGREEMKRIFSEENRLRLFLDVEAALALAHGEAGDIPAEAARAISKNATTARVKLARVKAIEAETRHDMMALVKALAEMCGDAGRFVHLGATSNDIIDTATALQLKEAMELIRGGLERLARSLARLALAHKRTVMAGRTHGQIGVPTTFGLKIAVFAMEFRRHIERFEEAGKRVCAGKMSGAVGTGAALGPKAVLVQELTMRRLDLAAAEASNQIVQRDRYAEYVMLCAGVASSLEKLATEVRNLQRSEIGEVAEPFDEAKQVGSSTMAQKRNPIISENICGLARIVRGFVVPAMENVVLWHERDLTNSSAERFILPHVSILTDHALASTVQLVEALQVFPDRMLKNLESTKGMVMAESLMMGLVAKGLGRQEAHELVRRLSIEAEKKGLHLLDAAWASPDVKKRLNRKDLERLFAPENYIGAAVETVEQVGKMFGLSDAR